MKEALLCVVAVLVLPGGMAAQPGERRVFRAGAASAATDGGHAHALGQ